MIVGAIILGSASGYAAAGIAVLVGVSLPLALLAMPGVGLPVAVLMLGMLCRSSAQPRRELPDFRPEPGPDGPLPLRA